MQEKRVEVADLLKGLAVICMIQVHVLELFTTSGFQESKLATLLFFLGAAPVAPVFMIVLGYFLAASKKSTAQTCLRGIKAFGLGLLLNLGLNFNLIIKITKGEIQLNVWPYVFGVDILLFAGLAIIILAVLKKLLEKNIFVPVVLIGIILLGGEFLTKNVAQTTEFNYVISFFYGSSEWSYFPLMPWLAYPLTGFIIFQFAKTKIEYNRNAVYLKIVVFASFFVFVFFTYKEASNISKDLPNYYHHGMLFYVWALIFIGPSAMMLKSVNASIGNTLFMLFVKFLGKNVTLIYVIQWLIIGNTATEIYRSLSSSMRIGFVYLAVLILSSLLAYALVVLRKFVLKLKAK